MNEDIWRIIMKRLLVVVISIIAGLTRLSAQEAGTGVIEIGAGCSLYGMLGAIGGPYRFLSPGVFTEYRYGIAERFDLGAQLNYRFGNGESEYFGPSTPWRLRYNQLNLKAVADFKMRPSRTVRPFIGMAVGGGVMSEERIGDLSVVNWTVHPKEEWYFGTVGWRFGLHIKRFRVAIETDLAYDTEHWNSVATATALNVGFSF